MFGEQNGRSEVYRSSQKKKNSINISSLETFVEETEGRKSRRDRREPEKGRYYMKTEHLVQYNSMYILLISSGSNYQE